MFNARNRGAPSSTLDAQIRVSLEITSNTRSTLSSVPKLCTNPGNKLESCAGELDVL